MQSLRPTRRNRGRAIAWAPKHDSYYVLAGILRDAASIPPLHLTQSAVLELEAQLENDPSPVPFGLLAGALCVSPQTKLNYLVVDEIAASRSQLTAANPTGQLADELRLLASSAVQHGKLVLGWYIGEVGDELQLDLELASVHRAVFTDAWQVALLRAARIGGTGGALVRLEAVTNRSYQIPFFELLPDSPRSSKSELPRTAIRWPNYAAAEPVLPLNSSHDVNAVATQVAATRDADGRARTWLASFRAKHWMAPQPPSLATHGNGRAKLAAPVRPIEAPRVDAPVAQSRPVLRPPAVDASAADDGARSPPASVTTSKAPFEYSATANAEVDQPADSSAVEIAAHAPPMQQLFINGVLVAFPEEAPAYADEKPLLSEPVRQRLVAAMNIALILIGLAGLYMIAR